jgi:hypothetical protein
MIRFPDDRHFAFSIFDDTDQSTVSNIAPVYRFLAELGMRTTKSVWPLASVPSAPFGGSSLADKDYLAFVLGLQDAGFEIGLHGVRNYSATRDLIAQGLDRFHDLLGYYPRTYSNHLYNRDNIYWGKHRLSIFRFRSAYRVATGFAHDNYFEGHSEESPYFWGDMCARHMSYVRNLVFREINLERTNPTLPDHDPTKPFVNYWFSSSEGARVESFCRMLCEANQDRLEQEGGVCIMYTHFACGFCDDGVLHSKFEGLMRRLVKKHGWFVPVATLLDYLRARKADNDIPQRELVGMERRWLLSKLRKGHS